MPAVTTEVVANAALMVLDAAGQHLLSPEAVASEIGCPTDQVKQLAPSNGDLLDLAVDRIYAEVDLRPLEVAWPDRLRTYARSFRQALLRHPRGAIAVATRPIVSVSSMAVAERALSEMTREGFNSDEANRLLLVIVSFVTGHALTEIGGRYPDLGGHEASEVETFRQQLPADTLPLTSQSVSHVNRDAEFELGLKLIIDGLERRLLHALP